uniref:Uncharacterized protein n=1 Tax=Arion vulgaris TaxID=1028688 RepID=A0A0B7AUG1_9EUPU
MIMLKTKLKRLLIVNEQEEDKTICNHVEIKHHEVDKIAVLPYFITMSRDRHCGHGWSREDRPSESLGV